MNSLNSGQREKVRNFVVFTNTSEAVAIEILKKYEWNLEVACDNYFQNPEKWERILKKSDGDRIDPSKIDKLFEIYRGGSMYYVKSSSRVS
jgi:DCN1-like protein 1/2